MKRCPECRRDYYDDSLLYCLDDGAALLEGPSTAVQSSDKRADSEDQRTAIFQTTDSTDAPTLVKETNSSTAGHPVDTVEDKPASRSGRKISIAVIGILVLVGAGVGLVYKLSSRGRSITFSENRKITRLTNTGQMGAATISPDGKYVAYSTADEAGQSSLWVRHVATTSNVQVVPPVGADVNLGQTTFSPDGNHIYYIRSERNIPATLYAVPVLGGPSRKIADRVTRVTFAPDGQRFVFTRRYPNEGTDKVIIANSDGSNEQILSVRKNPEYYLAGAAWSPDGATVACPIGGFEGGYFRSVIFIDVATGTEKPIPFHRWNNLERLVWLPDGSGVLTTANDRPADPYQIWSVSYPSGETRQLSNDLTDYHNVSVTADSSTIAAIVTDTTSNLWVAPYSQPGGGQQITSTKSNGRYDVTWTPDGKVLYDSNAGGNFEIWSVGSDGRDRHPVTDDGEPKRYACVTPNGKYIVTDSYGSGRLQLWRTNADGSNRSVLTTGTGFGADCSRSDESVVYTTFGPGGFSIWKVSINGGEPTPLINQYALIPSVSPDGKLIACYTVNDPGGGASSKIGIYSIDGGEPINVFDMVAPAGAGSPSIRWLPDGRTVAYIATRGRTSNIWLQSIDGGAPKQLTDFKNERVFWFSISLDGRQLALSRGSQMSDVVLIKDFK